MVDTVPGPVGVTVHLDLPDSMASETSRNGFVHSNRFGLNFWMPLAIFTRWSEYHQRHHFREMVTLSDAKAPTAPSMLFEPNAIDGEDSSTAWFVDSPSFTEWRGTWLDRRGWCEEDQVDDDSGMEPRPEATDGLR
ncbi:hypothetical protein [Streptomyces camelliae]|uniref:Fatty acid desaturase domain-containing protein n=1 Tax=Streptomyces camelliae TaxID=3004093 RepID=A0ABY7P085_9ACTN|nr:hypothetical protein [Streptomyces sp. HUAS 2-6]WBO61683.1 hypothetical protein O1G22_01840 [Streptomyces sp. HUAS 2-6]